jgi:hypothetical protein
MCTRRQALRRLIAKWVHEVDQDPATAYRLLLRRILTEENVQAVVALDLYSDFDDFDERQRGREALRAWLKPQSAVRQ